MPDMRGPGSPGKASGWGWAWRGWQQVSSHDVLLPYCLCPCADALLCMRADGGAAASARSPHIPRSPCHAIISTGNPIDAYLTLLGLIEVERRAPSQSPSSPQAALPTNLAVCVEHPEDGSIIKGACRERVGSDSFFIATQITVELGMHMLSRPSLGMCFDWSKPAFHARAQAS